MSDSYGPSMMTPAAMTPSSSSFAGQPQPSAGYMNAYTAGGMTMGDTSGWKMQGATETTSMFYPGSAVSSAYGYGGGGGGGGGGNYGNIGMTAHPNNN